MEEYGLAFEETSVHFIYSFFIDIDKTIDKINDKTKDTLKTILTNSDNSSKKLDSFESVKGEKKSRKGVPPNLRVNSHEFFKSFSIDDVDILQEKDGKDVKILPLNKENKINLKALVRIYDSGIGTITLTLEMVCSDTKNGIKVIDSNSLIKARDTFKIYDLVNMRDDADYKYPKIQFKPEHYLDLINSVSNDKTEICSKRLIEIYSDILSFLNKSKKILYRDLDINSENNFPIVDNSYPNLDCQNPYVVLTCKKPNAKNDSTTSGLSLPMNWWDYSWTNSISNFDFKNQSIFKRKFRETALLLFRFIKGSAMLSSDFDEENFNRVVALPFSNQNIAKHFKNYSWFENIFVASHPRSTIVFYVNINNHGSEKEVNDIPTFVCESILDLFELIRSRWHFSVILNEMLDQDITMLKSVSATYKKDFIVSILERRRLLATFLSDPLTYSFEGGMIFDLMEDAKKSFQLDYLKNMIESKFEVVDDLINDLMLANI